MDNQFNESFVKMIAANIPCIHMNSFGMASRVTLSLTKYLEDLKFKGLNTIDDVLKEINSIN